MRATLYRMLSGAESDSSKERDNFFLHAITLTLSKIADGLIDPKIVLSWMVTALGAPAALAGFLVPVREAGALMPQLLIAPAIRSAKVRKWYWVAGSLGQGVCVTGMAIAAFTLTETAAGIAILCFLALFSVCRAVCSTSHKDVLGKTVKKSTRGATTGFAGSLGATGVLIFGVLLATGLIPRTITALAIVMMFAGLLWCLAALVFARVQEDDSVIGDGNVFSLKALIDPLSKDPQLRRFIVVRALLIPSALAPPFLITLTVQSGDGAGAIGPFILASALASILSGYMWGRLSDRSSRRTFMAGGGLVALVLLIAAFISIGPAPDLWLVIGMLFLSQTGYEGVRTARKIHLVDMAGEDKRAVYTALSNTLIGIILLAGGILGVLAQAFGVWAALGASALLCFAGAVLAGSLEEVQSA